jgi:hypothetical protein
MTQDKTLPIQVTFTPEEGDKSEKYETNSSIITKVPVVHHKVKRLILLFG